MLKTTIKNNITMYIILLLLSLNACNAEWNKTSTTVTQKANEQKTKTVINFQELVLKHGSEGAALDYIMTLDMVILDFYTDWCPPCRLLAPILVSLSKLITPVTFVKINAEIFKNISQKFNIRAYPTLICFRNGVKINTVKVTLNESELAANIKRLFNLS